MIINARFFLRAALFTLLAAALTGCWGDDGGSSGTAGPAISGRPATSAVAGIAYQFHPNATAGKGAQLRFSVTNRPSWALFDTSTGTLSGTPAANDAGTYARISIGVTDGSGSATLAPFSIRVTTTGPQQQRGPAIAGSPGMSVAANSSYTFRPTTSSASGALLSFSIANAPAWAHFDPATGTLSGTPASANVGTYANIVISVSDAAGAASLAPFSIVVTQANAVAANISWTIPPSGSSQSAAMQLAGYRIYYGASAENMSHVVNVDDPSTTNFVLADLDHGTWYFAIASYNESKIESVLSPTVSVSL